MKQQQNLFLIGPMGAGKSAVGRQLAGFGGRLARVGRLLGHRLRFDLGAQPLHGAIVLPAFGTWRFHAPLAEASDADVDALVAEHFAPGRDGQGMAVGLADLAV